MQYPDGWFNSFDMQAYRRLVARVPREGAMVEVGAYKGRSICSVSELIIERDLQVTLVDPFLMAVGENDAAERQAERRLALTIERLGFEIDVPPILETKPLPRNVKATLLKSVANFGLRGRGLLISEPSIKAAKRVDDGSVDFVFIDGDHSYDGLVGDVYAWWPKLKPDGFMAGHDYTRAGGTVLYDEMRLALHDVFGGPKGLEKPHNRSTVWLATCAPRFLGGD